MRAALSRRSFGRLAGATGAFALARPAIAQSRPELVVSTQTNPGMTEPTREIGNVGFRVLYSVFDYLIMPDFRADMALRPGLATEWRRIDGRTVELKLRQNVRFHNGDPMTAEDVAFTFGPERMSAPNAPAFGVTRYAWGNLDRVEVVSSDTVRFVSKETDPILELRLSGWTGQIVNKRAFQSAGGWDAWSRMAVGTGPFKVVENRPGQYIRLEAFDDYWGGRPNVSAVTFRVVPEVAARIAGLAAGETHIATDIPPDQFGSVTRHTGVEIVGGPIMNHRVITFDCRNPIIADARVRRVLSLSLDRDAITQALWGGKVGVPHSHQWTVFGALFNGERPKPGFDPAAAKRLLQEAGYRGEQLMYRTMNDYYINEIATAEAMVDMWKAVGLNVRIEVTENGDQMRKPENAAIHNWSNTASYPDPVGAIWRLYGSDAFQQKGGMWRNAEFNRLGGILNTSMDAGERNRAFQAMLDIFDTIDPPAVILHEFGAFYGKRANVRWTPYSEHYMDLRRDAFSLA